MSQPRRWTLRGDRFIITWPPILPSERVEVVEAAAYDQLRDAARELAHAAERWVLETGPGQHVNTANGRPRTRRALDALRAVLDGDSSESEEGR